MHAHDLEILERLQVRFSILGEETCSLGDKCIGTNHILQPEISQIYRRRVGWKISKTVTYQRMTKEASRKMGGNRRQCMIERMEAHALTAAIRVERYADHK